MAKGFSVGNAAGRPRDNAVDDAVLAATFDLLSERGYDGLRINDIAAASKTAKTTIYRRWPTMAHLVVAAMEHALGQRSFPSGASLEDDLDGFVGAALSFLTDGRSNLLPVALDIHRQPDADLRATYRQRIIDPLRNQAIALVAAAVERGELAPSTQPDVVVDAVVGGLIYRGAVLAEPVTADDARDFCRAVLVPCGYRAAKTL